MVGGTSGWWVARQCVATVVRAVHHSWLPAFSAWSLLLVVPLVAVLVLAGRAVVRGARAGGGAAARPTTTTTAYTAASALLLVRTRQWR